MCIRDSTCAMKVGGKDCRGAKVLPHPPRPSLIAMVAGFTQALKDLAKQDGGKAHFWYLLKRSVTRDIVQGFIAS